MSLDASFRAAAVRIASGESSSGLLVWSGRSSTSGSVDRNNGKGHKHLLQQYVRDAHTSAEGAS